MTFATLRALHAAIGTGIDDIERVYREHTEANPVEFPSLNEPYYRTAQHTPDEELAEALKDDPAVVAASMRIVAACAQLSTTVSKPWLGLMEDMLWAGFSHALRFVEAANIVEILREAGPVGLHVRDIHRLVLELRTNVKGAAPADGARLTPAHLSHILRLLATGHYLREVAPDVFANNRASSYIDTGKTVAQLREAPEKKYNDTDGVAAYVGVIGGVVAKSISYLTEWALGSESQSAAAPATAQDSAVPVALRHPAAPFNLAFDTQLAFFPWLELPGNEGRLVRFGQGMTGTRQFETKDEILRAFPWDTLPQGAVLMDVGGGIGAQTIVIADSQPHIRVVVEDTEQVVSTAISSWGPQYTHLFESGRMSWRVRDFFEAWVPLAQDQDLEGPAQRTPGPGQVAGSDAPDVFLLRSILHDWKDEECKRQVLVPHLLRLATLSSSLTSRIRPTRSTPRRILSQLRAAAGPHTKLVAGEMLLHHACADDAAYAAASGSGGETFPFVPKDSPLLPNLGVANILGYFKDMVMLSMFDAKERTEDEFAALLRVAGWELVEIRRTPGSVWGYMTAVPV
ncbi:hypothetical protein GSI_08341 [Ganoderma sinense ZZ0214-1]|uniref:O-methyltransferase C-terminal domain-containing protein n=1 Tax=Ganoderma sinense ZZ0214-1 TaxID=1077348 RepID=A0A2G8S6Y4_9APHY|nr:hypothetical protein GSI_08341 [Ganoderma sinense ZZ0214-1]